MTAEIKANLIRVRTEITTAAAEVDREEDEIKLIAVSKLQPDERIDAALAGGHRIFGENRVQEAAERWRRRPNDHADLELHLIGPLQSNKAKDAVALFDVIQTVDRPKIAATLAREFDKQDRRLPCYVEINTGCEVRKSGIGPDDADRFIARVRDEFQLPLVGLMCIPPIDEEPALHFALLRDIAKRNEVERLSMGMSGDYAKAVRFGATDVRIGTAIFGARRAR